jgi:hypothetical protein
MTLAVILAKKTYTMVETGVSTGAYTIILATMGEDLRGK